MAEDIIQRIEKLKREKNAVILAHNYQPPHIQDIADMCGDSLELSIRASRTEAGIIVFCGVQFMAETASVLCPQKTVILPAEGAGCPMADMITDIQLANWRKKSAGIPVIAYVNSSAAVKALADICCTSANSIKVAESLFADEVLLVPDRNLARYTDANSAKSVHAWNGYCPYHERLSLETVERRRGQYPDALFMAHPECRPEVLETADQVASTSGMLAFARSSEAKSFIVGTEVGLLHPLRKACPDKLFVAASERMECVDMKKISLEAVAASLENLSGVVRVPEHVREPAMRAVQNMIEL
ncbi:MAG TPA: quinolinate synthase NadA [Desulfosalsimonadaceae bacterium]|nr:quinolinate synthase NadA [Desulfosalsimonadaceae bacterium]